jgi:hypothetical protein
MYKKRIREVKNRLHENQIPLRRLTAVGYSHKPIVSFITLSEYLPQIQEIYPNVETVTLADDINMVSALIECFIRF